MPPRHLNAREGDRPRAVQSELKKFFDRPWRIDLEDESAKARDRSNIAGVTSIPVACCTTCAKAHTTSPPPHATSSTRSCGPASLNSTSSCRALSSAIVLALEKGIAWRVNWSRINSWCEVAVMGAMNGSSGAMIPHKGRPYLSPPWPNEKCRPQRG